MELGESRRRLGAWLLAGVGAVVLAAAGTASVRADQSNDNSSTTTASAGDPIVVPVTGAAQVNVACPLNVNVLADQAGSGSCAPGAQSNSNSSATTAGGDSPGLLGGTLLAPITAAAQLNLSCPINVNVVSRQSGSGNCAPGDQSNGNTADVRARRAGDVAGLLGGPIVAPVTTGVGLNVTCPTDVNVLSAQQASGDCVDQTDSAGPPLATSPPPGTTQAPPPDDSASGPTPDSAALVQAAPAPDAAPGDSPPPGPPDTGAFGIGGSGGFPALGAIVLAVLAAAAMAVRRFQRQR